MKKYIPHILLGLIILVAIATRLYKLGDIPVGFYVDEAGQGYSAYSILKTGKDEFGKSFPIVFRSLTDFKTPIYTYLIIPFIPIFGLNTFTVRLPSALFGSLIILILYFLIVELSKNKKLALISTFLLTISPWHILFSRTDFECTVALTLFIAGVFLFYKSFKKPYLLLFSAFMLALSLPAYQAERILVPTIFIGLLIKYKRILFDKTHKPYLIAGAVIGLIISLPTLSIALTPGFLARASGLNIFSHLRQMPDGFISSYTGILSPIVNGSWFLSIREFLGLYFSYLSPRYMFILGDYGQRSSFPELSTYYLWQFPFYIYGLWILFKNKNLGEIKFFTIAMFLISPIPAAVTRDPYTTIRALPLVVPQIIIISIGLLGFYEKLRKNAWKTVAIIVFSGLIIYSVFKLYGSVIILNEYYRAKYWDYGWREVTDVLKNGDQSLPVVVDNARSDPDLQIAFFLKYDPIKYQKENFEIPLNQYYTNLYRNPEKHIGNITVKSINWQRDLAIDEYLVADELGISEEQIRIHKLKLIAQINYPNGDVAYRIVRTNPRYEEEQQRLFNSGKKIKSGLP